MRTEKTLKQHKGNLLFNNVALCHNSIKHLNVTVDLTRTLFKPVKISTITTKLFNIKCLLQTGVIREKKTETEGIYNILRSCLTAR